MPKDLLCKKRVSDICEFITREPATISVDSSPHELLQKMVSDPKTRHVYIIDYDKRIIGSVRLNSIIEYLFPYESFKRDKYLYGGFNIFYKESIRDIMNENFRYVYYSTPLSDMAELMIGERVNELPVVDTELHIIGEINMLEVISYYLHLKEAPDGK